MKLIHIFILTFSASVFASPDYSDTFAQMVKIDRFAYDGPTLLKGLSIEKIRELGVLKDEIKEEVENKYYEGEKIPYYTFVFRDGLKVKCRFITKHVSGPHVQLIYVKVTSRKWPILYNLGVGNNISQVKKYFGNTSVNDSSILVYQGETEEVRFKHKNGIITEVEFVYYAG